MQRLRIVFFGSGAIGIPALRSLIHDPQFEVAAVVTRPDAPAGRKMEFCATPVCRFMADELAGFSKKLDVESAIDAANEASEDKILVLAPEKVRGNKALQRFLSKVNADAFVVISFGQILTNLILDKVKWPVCVHSSALPKLRGASPVRTALLLGLNVTEVCTFLMTPRMDDGDVLARRKIQIFQEDNFQSLCGNFSLVIPALLSETLAGLADGTIKPEPQNEANATYTRLISKQDAWIDWNKPAAKVCNLVRAFTPDIGAVTTFRGKRIKIETPIEVSQGQTRAGAPGEITKVDCDKGYIEIAAREGSLLVYRIQPESRAWQSAREFVNGLSPKPGEIFHTKPEVISGRPPIVATSPQHFGEPAKIENSVGTVTDAIYGNESEEPE